jgi:hypothetical protein
VQCLRQIRLGGEELDEARWRIRCDVGAQPGKGRHDRAVVTGADGGLG